MSDHVSKSRSAIFYGIFRPMMIPKEDGAGDIIHISFEIRSETIPIGFIIMFSNCDLHSAKPDLCAGL